MEPFGFDDRPWTLNAIVGLGTPVGLAGAAVEYNPLSHLALGAGAGTNAVGPQLMGFVRVRPILWEKTERVFAISLEGAFSGGNYSSEWTLFNAVPLEENRTFEAKPALWVTGEAQFEYEARSGFHLVITGQGYAYLLNRDVARCRDSGGAPIGCGTTLPQGATLPAFRVELGYAFP